MPAAWNDTATADLQGRGDPETELTAQRPSGSPKPGGSRQLTRSSLPATQALPSAPPAPNPDRMPRAAPEHSPAPGSHGFAYHLRPRPRLVEEGGPGDSQGQLPGPSDLPTPLPSGGSASAAPRPAAPCTVPFHLSGEVRLGAGAGELKVFRA